MKSLTKVMTGMSVAALSVVLAGGINAEAATFDSAKTLKGITAGDSVSFDAVTKKGEYNTKAKWDLYEKAADADLSNLKTAKDSYIAVKAAAGTTTIYKVLADTQKKFKATCDGSEIKIEVDKSEVSDMTKFQWRTENSAWTSFTSTALDLTPYTMQGATLYIRYAGKTISPAANATPEKISVDGSDVTVQEIAADSFYTKEFKVKVPKKANAPAITVDYVNGVIKANKKAVYKSGTGVSAIISTAWPTATMADNFVIDNSQAGAFMMQIPADTAKKKAASKTSFFTWAQASAPTVTYTKPAVSGTTINNKTGDLISVSGGGKVSYEMKDAATAAKATFTITNTDGNTYDIYTAKTVDGKTVADKKVATLKKDGKVVLTEKKYPAASTKLIIRIAGDKKAMKLPSPFNTTTTVDPVYLETPAAPAS